MNVLDYLSASAPAVLRQAQDEPPAYRVNGPMANPRIEALKKLLKIDPNDDVAYFGLGKALMDEGQYAEAAGYLEQCVTVKPSYSAAYLALVEALLKTDQKDRAAQFLEQGHAVSVKNGDMQVTKKLEAIRQTLT